MSIIVSGHTFCRSCISKWLVPIHGPKQTRCPTCRREGSQLAHLANNPEMAQRIHQLEVYCHCSTDPSRGCGAKGKLGGSRPSPYGSKYDVFWSEHEAVCPNFLLPCQTCSVMIMRKYVSPHAIVCPKRSSPCPHCKTYVALSCSGLALPMPHCIHSRRWLLVSVSISRVTGTFRTTRWRITPRPFARNLHGRAPIARWQ